MRDAVIGLLIIFGIFVLADFLFSNNNVCKVEYDKTVKCGIIKQEFDIDINLFNRYW